MKTEKTPYVIGKKYLIRTVTMIYTGKLEKIFEHELVISTAAWIAETARWADSIKTGKFNEIEPYPENSEVVIGRDAILDATIVEWELPRTQK